MDEGRGRQEGGPSTPYAAFAPLGIALTTMLGAGVADRSGLFVTLVKIGLGAVPESALIPAVLLAGVLTTDAVDAGKRP